MEYVDVPIELKLSICSDEERCGVAVQLHARMVCVFETQPERTECWGVGLDSGYVLFVCCKRDLSYAVTPSINLWEGNGRKAVVWLLAGLTCGSRIRRRAAAEAVGRRSCGNAVEVKGWCGVSVAKRESGQSRSGESNQGRVVGGCSRAGRVSRFGVARVFGGPDGDKE
jgi:hypothetical protein